jgi:aspartate aminotransferase
MPTIDQLRPHLGEARLIAINSPLNPTGTVIDPEDLRSLTQAVVEENHSRRRQGRRYLFLLHDQVYGALTFGDAVHEHPVRLVPEAAPWIISLDAISKTFAATGLRVGWVTAAPELVARMKDVIGHLGAWAPRPEQVAVAEYFGDVEAVDAFQRDMNRRVFERLEALHGGFERLKAEGYPVESICPQGAIYLSLRLGLIGRRHRGRALESNEAIRQLLLEEAGLAVVPFQAFGLREDTGWFRLSVGAVSSRDIEQAFPRIRRLLDETD